MVTFKDGKYIIEKSSQPKKSVNEQFDVLYIANDSNFIIKSVLFSIHTLVETNRNIGRICILEDFKDRQLLEKAIKLWKSEHKNIFTINITEMVKKNELSTLYYHKYKNRYDVEYDWIVNAKMLVPLFSECFKGRSLLYIDSDMEVKADLKILEQEWQKDIMLIGIDEEDHKDDHDNQDVDTKKLHDAGYEFDYLKKVGSWQYLNTGILLFNVQYFNQMKTEDKVAFVRECFEMKCKCKFDFPEQDTMNIMWKKKCVPLYKYNVFSYKKDKLEDAKVIHYIWAGDGKKELEVKANELIYRKMMEI